MSDPLRQPDSEIDKALGQDWPAKPVKTVYKYPLAVRDEQEIEMPGKPVLFKVGLDPNGDLCVWALVEPHRETIPQRFFVVGTGRPVPAGARVWIGTVHQGMFMWHVFTP